MSERALTHSTAPLRPGWIGWAILVLALAGLILSAVSLVSHYKKSPTEYCDFNDNFNCDIVNRSVFSEIHGVPVAGVGVVGYLVLMALARLARRRPWALLMAVAALIGFAFAAYLTYIETYVLVVWCVLCLGSQVAITLILVLSVWQTVRLWRA
jgi:uncharacterized membrane protein